MEARTKVSKVTLAAIMGVRGVELILIPLRKRSEEEIKRGLLAEVICLLGRLTKGWSRLTVLVLADKSRKNCKKGGIVTFSPN